MPLDFASPSDRASRRRSWRKLHIGINGESGEIVAIELTKKESDDAARSDALLDQLPDPLASFTADGAYDQDRVYKTVQIPQATSYVLGHELPKIPVERGDAAGKEHARL
ncbi:MAG: transposase [Bradyrhizobium sp.]